MLPIIFDFSNSFFFFFCFVLFISLHSFFVSSSSSVNQSELFGIYYLVESGQFNWSFSLLIRTFFLFFFFLLRCVYDLFPFIHSFIQSVIHFALIETVFFNLMFYFCHVFVCSPLARELLRLSVESMKFERE